MVQYLSVCSGIEAASAAWHPLGWRCNGVAEIESFPAAVLSHHYPQVHNFGDITKFKDWPNDPTIDVLVGGTPCQSFSVAGLRKGLDDPRGNLALTFLGIADRYSPEWLIWENVPGVLSLDEGRAFGSILGGMAELGYHVSYRVLDAQYVRVDGLGRAVPQRRRRVFVVGNLRDWRRAAAVLFEPESLSWDTAPRRETGQGIAPTISSRPTGGGALGTDFDLDGGCVITAPTLRAGGNRTGGDRPPGTDVDTCDSLIAFQSNAGRDFTCNVDRSPPLRVGSGLGIPSGPAIAYALRADGFDASEDGTGRGTPIIPIDMRQASRGETMTNNRVEGSSGGAPGTGIGEIGDPSPTIASSHIPAIAFAQNQRDEVREVPVAGALAAEPGMKQQTYIAFSSKDHGADAGNTSPTLRTMGHDGSHANAGGQVAVAFQPRFARNDRGAPSEIAHALTGEAGRTGKGDSAQCVQIGWAVRRLTPLECERLQGFPDGYTDVPYRGKKASDGPRYKTLGNSMAVNVMRWLGRRIDMVSSLSATPL